MPVTRDALDHAKDLMHSAAGRSVGALFAFVIRLVLGYRTELDLVQR